MQRSDLLTVTHHAPGVLDEFVPWRVEVDDDTPPPTIGDHDASGVVVTPGRVVEWAYDYSHWCPYADTVPVGSD